MRLRFVLFRDFTATATTLLRNCFNHQHVTLRAARESLPSAAPETNGVSSVQQQQA
jgi:hypothetical protein